MANAVNCQIKCIYTVLAQNSSNDMIRSQNTSNKHNIVKKWTEYKPDTYNTKVSTLSFVHERVGDFSDI